MNSTKEARLKRCYEHDYHERCIYLITVTVEGRLPLLGKVEGTAEKAWIVLSETGRAVWREIERIPVRWPQVKVLQHQIMPDHVHLVLYVTERLPEALPLGNVVAAWKQACGKAYSALHDLKAAPLNNPNTGDLKATTPNNPTTRNLKAAPQDNQQGNTTAARGGLSGEAAFRPPTQHPVQHPYCRLFAKGFNDSILTGKGQLRHMMAYVRDNPRRLLIKQQSRGYFAIHRGITVAGMTFDAVGNLDLLRQPLLAVHCRRRWSADETAAFAARCQEASANGTVLVGAFISKAEHEIAHRASEAKRPMIHLVENVFDDFYKPVGGAFYACAEGRLLQLAPWPYHNDTRPIIREQCRQPNEMAERISNNIPTT